MLLQSADDEDIKAEGSGEQEAAGEAKPWNTWEF